MKFDFGEWFFGLIGGEMLLGKENHEPIIFPDYGEIQIPTPEAEAPATELYSSPRNPASRPVGWTEFIGSSNGAVVERLKMAISAAQKENRCLPHTLLYGGPGLGKTTISRILATEMHGELIETVGSSIDKQGDIYSLFCDIQLMQEEGKNVILFIDEIHDIARKDAPETLWFPIFEEFTFFHNLKNSNIVYMGERYLVMNNAVYLKPFTIVGATTDPGELSQPLRDRFPVQSYLQPYTIEDLAEIIIKYSEKKGFKIAKQAALALGKRARGTPRTAINLLIACRDRAIVGDVDISDLIVAQQMSMDGIDEEGLTALDIKVLTALAHAKKGLGLANLAGASGVNRSTIEEMVEPLLKQRLYMETTHKRFITNKGLELLKAKGAI